MSRNYEWEMKVIPNSTQLTKALYFDIFIKNYPTIKALTKIMDRPLSIEYPGAFYHVTSQGRCHVHSHGKTNVASQAGSTGLQVARHTKTVWNLLCLLCRLSLDVFCCPAPRAAGRKPWVSNVLPLNRVFRLKRNPIHRLIGKTITCYK